MQFLSFGWRFFFLFRFAPQSRKGTIFNHVIGLYYTRPRSQLDEMFEQKGVSEVKAFIGLRQTLNKLNSRIRFRSSERSVATKNTQKVQHFGSGGMWRKVFTSFMKSYMLPLSFYMKLGVLRLQHSKFRITIKKFNKIVKCKVTVNLVVSPKTGRCDWCIF